MALSREEKLALFKNKKYHKSAKYDFDWVIENQMGSNCLWLTESVADKMDLVQGSRLLDFGCGKAVSSIFLAKEYNVNVFASDYWISPSDNMKRIKEAQVDNSVFPIHAEAHQLPFADESFDNIISINSFQFYATSEYYLKNNIGKLLKPDGKIGIVVPGLYNEIDGEVPEYLIKHWEADYYSWHTAQWWERHFQRSGIFEVELADSYEGKDGYNMFLNWGRMLDAYDGLAEEDLGRNITFVRLVAHKK